MKKQIREHLVKIAKQILSEEDTLDTISMKKHVGDLYDKLTVVEYLENQLESDFPVIEPVESLDSKSFREENWFTEPEPVPQSPHKEDLIEPLMEKIKDIVAQMPEESGKLDDILNEMLPKSSTPSSNPGSPRPVEENIEPPIEKKGESEKKSRNELDDFAEHYKTMPEFERKTAVPFPESTAGHKANKHFAESRSRSVNESISKGLNIGLNDRLAFIKHLFEGQTEDYTRVLSQINTMDSFDEARKFIHENVKPDYDNWNNKEVYSERFMHLIEKSFN